MRQYTHNGSDSVYKEIVGLTTEPLEIKAIGDKLVIDGVNYIIDEVNTEKEEETEVYYFGYKLAKGEVFTLTEEQKKELQQL